jgi:hypothetical protein
MMQLPEVITAGCNHVFSVNNGQLTSPFLPFISFWEDKMMQLLEVITARCIHGVSVSNDKLVQNFLFSTCGRTR